MSDERKRRPSTKTLKSIFEWLEEQGLSVYGQHMDVDSGEEMPGCRDYDVSDVIKRYNHIKNGTLWRDE